MPSRAISTHKPVVVDAGSDPDLKLAGADNPADQRRVYDEFESAYATVLGTDRGKFWTDRYAPGLAAYARLHFHRDERVEALATGGAALLDVGCGYGDLLYRLRNKYKVLAGLDPSATVVSICKDNLASRGVENHSTILRGVAEELPFDDGSFDTLAMLDTYEHIHPDQRRRALDQARRVLIPGGQLIIATPSRPRLKFWALLDNLLTRKRQARAGLAPRSLFDTTPKDFCEVFVSRAELRSHITSAGFRITRFEHTSFYPAPERGGFLGPYLEPLPRDHPAVRLSLTLTKAIERLSIANQKMLVVATKAG